MLFNQTLKFLLILRSESSVFDGYFSPFDIFSWIFLSLLLEWLTCDVLISNQFNQYVIDVLLGLFSDSYCQRPILLEKTQITFLQGSPKSFKIIATKNSLKDFKILKDLNECKVATKEKNWNILHIEGFLRKTTLVYASRVKNASKRVFLENKSPPQPEVSVEWGLLL